MVPVRVIDALVRFGVEVFSITDHNSWGNSRVFSIAAKRAGLLFVPGIELQSSEEVHILAYFNSIRDLETFGTGYVQPFYTPGDNDPAIMGEQTLVDASGRITGCQHDLLALPLQHTLDGLVAMIHDQGGVAVPAHLDKAFSLISQLGFVPPELGVDAFEVYDASRIEEMERRYLKGVNSPVISSSDTHHPEHFSRAGMRMWLTRPTVHEVLEAIRGERKISVRRL